MKTGKFSLLRVAIGLMAVAALATTIGTVQAARRALKRQTSTTIQHAHVEPRNPLGQYYSSFVRAGHKYCNYTKGDDTYQESSTPWIMTPLCQAMDWDSTATGQSCHDAEVSLAWAHGTLATPNPDYWSDVSLSTTTGWESGFTVVIGGTDVCPTTVPARTCTPAEWGGINGPGFCKKLYLQTPETVNWN